MQHESNMNPTYLANATDLLDQLEREVWIVTAADGPRRGGLAATSVSSASISPEAPRVVVAISRLHATWELIEKSKAFAVHLIASERLDLLERFGANSSREIDKFVGVPLLERSGPPILKDAIGWLECRVEVGWDAGDRTFFLGEIVDASPVAAQDVEIMTTRHLTHVPDDVRSTLRSQYEADAARDAINIREWRARQTRGEIL